MRERESGVPRRMPLNEKPCCRASGGSSKVGSISLPCSSKWNLQKQKRPPVGVTVVCRCLPKGD